jgi:HEAT repeat protein
VSTNASNLQEPSDIDVVDAALGGRAEDLAVLRGAVVAASARTRVLALRGLAHHGALDDVVTATLLADPDSEVRREVLEVLATSSARDALLEQVASLLEDVEPLVAEAAAYCVGEWESRSTLSALATALHHDDARVREAAVAALGSIGDASSTPLIIAALDDKPSVRRRAVVALSNFEGPEVDAALARAREDRDWQVRSAAEALAD